MSRSRMPGRWAVRTCALALALGIAAGLLAGCDDGDDGDEALGGTGSGTETGVQVEQDDALASALRGLSQDRRAAGLADLTDFSWSAVYVFSEGATAQQIEDAVGQPVLESERYYDAGNLLVFVSDDDVQRAVSVLPDLLVAQAGHGYGAAVRLVPHGSGTPALLRLQEG